MSFFLVAASSFRDHLPTVSSTATTTLVTARIAMDTTNNPNTFPYPPSISEAKYYYYGIPSCPLLVARSSANVWVEPTGLESCHIPKESSPIGWHPLREIWETTVGPAIIGYLHSKRVNWTSLDPVRMGYTGKSSPPIFVWMGIVPGSLSAEDGIQVATHCKSILSAHNINDVHVEIRESEVIRSTSPTTYKRFLATNATAWVREPFSTALGLPICAEATPSIEGTGGFFISDHRTPGKIYLVTARHVVFDPNTDSNQLYRYHIPKQRKNVLLFGDDAIKKHITAIESAIASKRLVVMRLEHSLKYAEHVETEGNRALQEARTAASALEQFLVDNSKDWKKPENRVLGHIVLSPPTGFNVGTDGFTEDWAVIEIDSSKVDLTNFIGNVIDLSTVNRNKFTAWMYPNATNPHSFKYPDNGLLKVSGTIPDEEMWKLSPRTLDHDNDPCIMVIQCGCTSDLTVGRLNGIRSFTRYCSKGQAHISKEIAVLPRNSDSGVFSCGGDSGSPVVDGKGRLAGMITGGAGDTIVSDCTYCTSINFLKMRMLEYGLEANLFPSL